MTAWKRSWLLGAALLVGAIAVVGFSIAFWSAQREPIKVVAISGPWAFGEASWLNEDTLVFRGVPGDQTWLNGRSPPGRAYLWHIGEQAQQISKNDDTVWRVCSNHGLPAYYVERGKTYRLVTMRGQDRSETEVSPPSDSAQANFARFAECFKLEDERMRGRSWVANAAGDTYLDFGDRRAISAGGAVTREVTLEPSEGGSKRELGTLVTPISPVHVLTPVWDHSFVLWDEWSLFTSEREFLPSIRVYRVRPDGKITVRQLVNHHALWSSSLIAYRDGYLAATAWSGDGRHAGLYRVDEKRAVRVLRGFMMEPVVSPSGCRLAVTDDMDAHGKVQFTSRLKIIDLCP